MSNIGKKLMFDIIPAVSREVVGGENIEVKPGDKNQSEAPNPIKSESVVEEKADVPAEINGPAFEDLLSNIIKEKIPGQEELSAMMERGGDPVAELASMGARIAGDFRPILAAKPNNPKNEEAELHRKILDRIREPVSPRVAVLASASQPKIISASVPENIKVKPQIKPDLMASVAAFYLPARQAGLPAKAADKKPAAGKSLPKISFDASKSASLKSPVISKPKPLNFSPEKRKRFPHKWIFILIALGLLAYGFTLKNELVRESFSALDNLQQAQESLKNYNFSGAAKNFNDSYNDFTKASQNLNMMGAGLAGILGDLPGLSKLKSAKDIVEAGKLLAGAGQAMSEAVDSLSRTGSILNPTDKNKTKPSGIVAQIKDALRLSDRNLQEAKILLADIDDSIIPEDKKESFHDFKDKIPLFEQYLGDAIEYADFLEGIVGIDEPKKYLLLFENNSELRPTGGFPGTYGVVSFASGGLANFFVDDVYNLDGQLKRNIVPPKQLQHITPNWGMRDSAWFADFPTSARKAMWFFEQESGYGVDGVITVNPDIVSAILGVVGPVKLTSYDMTLTADNFTESIQEEVEYGPNRTQPKQVVSDFAPLFLEKLYSADSEKWMKIFNVLMAGLDEKDILFYFNGKDLQDFSVKKGYAGEVKNTKSDYLMVTFSNIKGSKTDVVTDSSIDIGTRFEDGKVIHKVVIKRNHNGGDKEHGFYNRQNPAYTRVLLPRDSELISISGNDNPNYRPLTDYGGQFGFERDAELNKYEAGFYFDKVMGVDKYEESGRKGVGFWMITEPGSGKTVEFEYAVPVDYAIRESYDFYFQKQPGLDWKNFRFSVDEPEGRGIAGTFPSLNRMGNLHMLDVELKKDFNFNLRFK